MDGLSQCRFRKIDKQKIEIKPVGFKTVKELIHSLQHSIFDQQFEEQYGQQLNENVFIFKVVYDGQEWEIRRTIKQFEKLEEDYTNNFIQYFFKKKEVTKSLAQDNPQKALLILLSILKIYSSNVDIPDCVFHFLEISSIYLPLKLKECFMKKKAGGRQTQSCCKQLEQKVSTWENRYFIITQQSLLYLQGPDERNCKIRECLSFDNNFKFLYGKKQTGYEKGIVVEFSQRKLKLQAPDTQTYIDFIYSLFKAKEMSPYTKLHRFESFSPIRSSQCKWYIDGDQYFNDVYEAILKAEEMIYITDWWLSPELYLKRPVNVREFVEETENKKSRLDQVLEYVATKKGVKVLVILYNAPNLFLYNNPKHAKKQLESKSSNIRVLKHPSQVPPFPFSHHEKMVVIDQKIGFMGGLDLCFGRWDDQKHLLFDVHQYDQLWPQIDFSNSRIRDFYDVQNYQKTLMREDEPRMPWHDIAIQLQGDTVIDLARHFVQYWNFVMMSKSKKKKQVLLHANDLKVQTYKTPNNESFVNQSLISNSIYIGRKESVIQMKQPFLINHQDDNQETIRGDIEMNKPNLSFKAQQNSNLIQQKFKYLDIEEEDEEDQYQYYIPINNKQQKVSKIEKKQKNNQDLNAEGIQANINLEYCQPLINQTESQICITQLTRSSCKWSTGIKYTEKSIQRAYIELISNAKNFVYIENQFFMSEAAGEPLKNKISTVIIDRIKQAHDQKQKFKIVVFIPLLPGFEGEIDQSNSTILKIQLHYEYFTISRGGTSIIEQLKDYGINPSDYINFYGLRQHEKSQNGIPVTEIIYIHSKLLIVDDDIALIGSANINDRSLNGYRDSELAIIVQDQVLMDSKMNGQFVQVSKFAHTLRTELFMEHFGMTYEEVQDPLSTSFEKEARTRTSVNTKMYKEIFACYPDDKILCVADYAEFKTGKKLELYDQYSAFIKGHAVEFPLKFLSQENLKFKISNKEYYVSDENFT